MFSRRRLRAAESSLATRGAVGIVALAAGMTACGGGSDAQGQGSEVPQAVKSAYKTTTSADTVTVSISGSQQQSSPTDGGGQGNSQGTTLSGEALLDFAGAKSSMTMETGQAGGETRTIENVEYQKVPEGQREQVPDQKPWVKIDTQQLVKAQYGDRASEMQGNPPNVPGYVLTYLRGVTGAEEQGNEQVRGTQTTHYQTTVNLQQAGKGQGPLVEQQMQQVRQQLGQPTLPMQVWLDGQGRVRKLEAKLPAGGGGPGQSAAPNRMLMSQEFYDYGKTVDISAPAEGDTADLTQQYVQRIKMQQQMRRQQQQQQQQQGSPQPNQS